MTELSHIEVHERVKEWIEGDTPAPDTEDFEGLARELFAWQMAHNPVLARVSDAMTRGRVPGCVDDLPAMPTDAFKVSSVSCFDPALAERVFRTSGTTREARGVHALRDTSVYKASALRGAARWLLPRSEYRGVFLAPSEVECADSSLSFMLARFAERWDPGARNPFYVRGGTIDVALVLRALDAACHERFPVALLGTSFGFVHFLDALGDVKVALPEESVVMLTGGYKGRSREISPELLRRTITGVFGLDDRQIVGEYGMTELSSQAYEVLGTHGIREYRSPSWMRVTAVDPGSLERLPQRTPGLLRVVDLANVWSAIAIQTSDIGQTTEHGFEVLGRAAEATPRGCARALDALLSSR